MVKFVVIAFDDTWFKLSEGKILAYNYTSLSEEDKKPESDYKPGALFYFSDLESLVPGMDSMLKQGESSSFMATEITISENGNKAVIEGQQDAGMFFIPETLEFEVGVPTTNSTIFDSANPSQEFTLTPTAIYDTPEGLVNWRQEMDALKGKPLKAAETDVMKAEVNVGEKRILERRDYDIDNEVDIDGLEVGYIDLTSIEDEIVGQLNDEIVEAIKDSVDGELPLEDSNTGSDSVDISTDITLGMEVPIEGTVSFDWTANENYHDPNESDDWAAETYDPMMQNRIDRNECSHRYDYDGADAWMMEYADLMGVEDGLSYIEAGVKCGICGQERVGSWGINGREGFQIVKGQEGRMPRFYGAETFETEFVFNVADTSGETSDIHTYFVEAKDKDTAEEMLTIMVEDDYPGMSYEVMDVSMAEGYGTVSGRFSAESEDFFSAEEMMALDELHMGS